MGRILKIGTQLAKHVVCVGFGEIIFKEGESDELFYFIINGNVGAYKKESDKECLVDIFAERDFIGLVELMGASPHFFTAKVLNEVNLLMIEKKVLTEIYANQESLGLVLKEISKQCARYFQTMSNLKRLCDRKSSSLQSLKETLSSTTALVQESRFEANALAEVIQDLMKVPDKLRVVLDTRTFLRVPKKD